MTSSTPTPVSGAILSTGNRGQHVITCKEGAEGSTCAQWGGERIYPASAVNALLQALAAAGALVASPPAPITGAVLASSKHGQKVVTCRPGTEDADCKLWNAERMYSATDVNALQLALQATTGNAQASQAEQEALRAEQD